MVVAMAMAMALAGALAMELTPDLAGTVVRVETDLALALKGRRLLW